MADKNTDSEREATEETRTAESPRARDDDPAADSPGLRRGARLGRYTILNRIGRGGMGVVYAAYDPKLDRRVALKLLRADLAAHSGKEAHTRLLREAQAMARLSHPNVIAVYDVGVFEAKVYVAMEYVPGRSLSRWLREEKPPWPEIIEVVAQAGRGLAAAHASGLVHRDFKPANVMVGDDGRARVLDFGLARPAPRRGDQTPPEDRAPKLTPDRDPLQSVLTEAGTVVGTPFYMSPEQYHNRADERSDQYSFCVALYEGLYGVRPFSREDRSGLRARVLSGEVRPPPHDTRVPSRYLDIIKQGMSLSPKDRFPSMNALLATLTRSRRRLWRSVTVALVVTAAAAGLLVTYLAGNSGPVCRPAAAKLAGVWDGPRKEEIHRAFVATGAPYAEPAWLTVAGDLDRYRARWLEMHRDTCLATEVRHEQSARLLDLRMLCLDQRLGELRALTDLFARADTEVVERAVHATAELTAIARCSDVRALTERVEPPTDLASRLRIAAVREQIAEASALRAAGKFAPGLEVAEVATLAARAIGFLPLQAEALLIQGALQLRAGDAQAAAATLIDAELAALAGRDDDTATLAATELVSAVGYRLGRHQDGDTWARTAKAILARGAPNPAIEAEVEINLAMIRTLQGKYEEAEAHARQALALRRRAFGEDHQLTAAAHHTVGVMLKKRGEYRLALAAYQRSLEILRAAVGDDHPDVAMALHNIGVVERRLGDDRQAIATLERALEIWTRALPADHPNIGMALLNLGVAEVGLGELAAAERHLERARAIKAGRAGVDHWSTANADLALATVYLAQGRTRAALDLQQDALARLETALGDTHPDVALALGDVADSRLALGDHDGAGAAYQRALAVLEQSLADDHPDIADLRVGLARVALAQRDPTGAIAPLEQAVAAFRSHDHPTKLAAARFLLAQALGHAPARRAAAGELAEQALAAYRDLGDHAAEIDDIERWLAGRSRE